MNNNITHSKNHYKPNQGPWSTFKTFGAIWKRLNRRAELQRLVLWAERKRLAGPLKAYWSRLADEEIFLAIQSLDHPKLSAIAWALHEVMRITESKPRYHKHGAAAAYRSRRSTKGSSRLLNYQKRRK
jgi:hypothetical protein